MCCGHCVCSPSSSNDVSRSPHDSRVCLTNAFMAAYRDVESNNVHIHTRICGLPLFPSWTKTYAIAEAIAQSWWPLWRPFLLHVLVKSKRDDLLEWSPVAQCRTIGHIFLVSSLLSCLLMMGPPGTLLSHVAPQWGMLKTPSVASIRFCLGRCCGKPARRFSC